LLANTVFTNYCTLILCLIGCIDNWIWLCIYIQVLRPTYASRLARHLEGGASSEGIASESAYTRAIPADFASSGVACALRSVSEVVVVKPHRRPYVRS
jgi:hypothetical protein